MSGVGGSNPLIPTNLKFEQGSRSVTRKYLRLVFISFLSVLSLAGCVTTSNEEAYQPIYVDLTPQYKSCISSTPAYLLTAEGVGDTEQAATISARSNLAQQIKVIVKVENNLQINTSDTVQAKYQSNASTQSEILLTNSIVLCKELSSGLTRIFIGYDNRSLDIKLESILTKHNIQYASQLRGPSLLVHSNVFEHLDSSEINNKRTRQLPVSLSHKNDIWYLNIGHEGIALTPDELSKITSFKNVGKISLVSRSGQVFKDNRLSNGDVFKISYMEPLSENSYFTMFIQAQDGSISLLYDNLEFNGRALELPEIQACMSYDDDGGCQSLPDTSKDKLIAVTSSSRINTLQIEKMQHSYEQSQAVNRYQLPELIASLSEVESVNVTSAFVFVSPYNN